MRQTPIEETGAMAFPIKSFVSVLGLAVVAAAAACRPCREGG